MIKSEEQGTHEAWIDALKGLAIILVVLGHILDGATGQSLFANDGWMIKLHEAIYIFHMPLFFLLSGAAFAIYTDPRTEKVNSGGYIEKCANLLLLYVFWSAVMYYSKRIFSSEATKVLEEPFLWCLLFAPVDPYWYLIVLFCYYVFFAFLGILGVRFGDNGGEKNHKRMLLAGAVISGFAPAVLTFFSEKPALFLYRLLYHFVFFAAGVALIRHGNRLKERFHPAGRIGVRNFLWPCFLIALLLLAAVCFDWLPAVPFVRECLAFGIIFLLIAWFCTHETWADQRWLNDLGRNSLYLYLVHNYMTVILRSLYKRSGLALPGGVYVCVCLVLTILICRIICAAAKKIPVFDLFFHPVKRIKELTQR